MDKILNFSMKNDTKVALVKIGRIILLIIISVISIMATYDWTISKFDARTAYLITAAVEFGLLLFAWKTNNLTKWYFIIWIGFLVYSIIASRSAIVDKLLISQQNQVHTSPEYQQYAKEKNINLDERLSLIAEQKTLQGFSSSDDKASALSDLNKQIAAKNSALTNTLSKYGRVRDDLKSEIKGLENSRNIILGLSKNQKDAEGKKNSRLAWIQDRLSTLDAEADKIESRYSEKVSLLSSPISRDVETNWWTVFFIFLEIVRYVITQDLKKILQNAGLSPNNDPSKKPLPKPEINTDFLSGKNISGGKISGATAKKYHLKNNLKTLGLEKKPEKQPKIQPKDSAAIEPIANNISQFKPKVVKTIEKQPKAPPKKQPRNDIDSQIYLEKAMNNLKPNLDFPSRADMAKLTGFSQEKCRTIHNLLKSRGVIQTSTSPRRTWLTKEAKEA
jgi:hypothetical protein